MPFAIQKQLNCYFVLYGLIFVITLRLKSSLIVIMYYFGLNFVMSFATQKQLNCYPVTWFNFCHHFDAQKQLNCYHVLFWYKFCNVFCYSKAA